MSRFKMMSSRANEVPSDQIFWLLSDHVFQVEAWLADLTEQMKTTLQELVVQCVEDSRKGRQLDQRN